jgi:hypothetical protein
MKRLIALSAILLALATGMPFALAQSSPPPLPALTPEQSATLQQRVDRYRSETEGRVSRGEITADEANRLIAWREWQIAQQIAGASFAQTAGGPSDVPPDYRAPPPGEYAPPRDVVVEAPPYYGPYYRYPPPYYWGPRPYPYYWGPAVCAGGFGRHFGGRVCF